MSDLGLARIHDDHFCAAFLSFYDPPGDQWMSLGCVGPDDKETICVGFEFGNRIRHGTTAEGSGQTGHRGSVSETCAVVDVICTDHGAGELLQKISLFVGASGRSGKADAVRTTFCLDLFKFLCYKLKRFLPSRLFQPSILPDQWAS